MPKENKQLHMITEAAAVFVYVPYFWFLADRQALPFDRNALKLFAMASFIVDGYLLYKWLEQQ